MRSLLSSLAVRPLLGAALIALALACDGRGVPPSAGSRTSHTALTGDPTCAETTVHRKHVARFDCVTCHPKGAVFGFAVAYTFPGGTTTAGGTIVRGTAELPTTCTVACHYPEGAPAKSVAWNAPGPLACTECHGTSALPAAHPTVAPNATRADCERCHATAGHMGGTVAMVSHPLAWRDQASPGFHAYSANAALSDCQSCHGADLAGGVSSGVACGQCHDQNLPAGVASWKVNCTMCHGDPDVAGGAPPRATWGKADDAVRVGAHAAHVSGSAIAPASGCAVCHVVPADALSSGHIDGGTAEVVFGGIAAAGAPTWNRSLPSCAVYCHGATLGAGGTNTAPSWTGGPSEAACGTCHGLPPPAPHAAQTACGSCHPDTVDASGAIIAPSTGGKHLDGVVEASGGHDATWMDPGSGGFHAFSANRDLASCTTCHGASLQGGMATGCASCHDGVARAAWGSCTMCHGGGENATGAPPKAIWGNRAAAGAANVGIGVHSTHVTGTGSSPGYGCEVCHVKPANVLAAGHADAATATVTFGGIASKGTTPAWDRTAATCATTYCHSMGGTYPTPVWTRVGLQQAGCNACHPTPPLDTNHRNYHWNLLCATCHPGASMTSVPAATHANGVKDVVNPALGGPWTLGWSDCGSCHSY